jgi:hypothetical protein
LSRRYGRIENLGTRINLTSDSAHIVDVEYKNCSAAWKEAKKRLAEDEAGFVAASKQALN